MASWEIRTIQIIFTALVALSTTLVFISIHKITHDKSKTRASIKSLAIALLLIIGNLWIIGALLPTVALFVKGGSSQELRFDGDPSVIIPAMDMTRAEFLEGMTKISLDKYNGLAYIGERVRVAFYEDRELPVGVYMPSERAIYLEGPTVDSFTFSHELHHDIWHWRLTKEEREEWNKIHRQVEPPTSYGLTDPAEDYADSGALYTHKRDMLDQVRLEFFDRTYKRMLCVAHAKRGSGECCEAIVC